MRPASLPTPTRADPDAALGLEALRELARDQRQRLYRIASRFVDHAAAEDLVQETLARAFTRRRDFRGEGSPAAWLCGILINLARGERRRRSVRRWLSLDRVVAAGYAPADQSPRPEEEAQLSERGALVREAVARLPRQQQLAIILVNLEGLSGREAATAMQTSEDAVWKALSRGRKRLRTLLHDQI